METILLFLANITVLIVYFTYIKQVIKGSSTPNPSTWIIWFAVTLLNALTYDQIVDSSLKGLIAKLAAILMLIIMIYSLVKGKFSSLKKIDTVALIACVIIGIFWKTTGLVNIANLLLQMILMIAFVPTIIGLIQGSGKEKPLPWILAVVAYVFQISALCLNLEGNYFSLVYPITNGLIGNGSVAVTAIIINRKAAHQAR